MRSKEVDKAIKVIQRDIKDWKEMLEIEIEFEDGIDEQQVAYLTQQITSYETLLSYIETLEQLPNKIREKIKELDKEEQELQNSISEEEREEYSDANISFLLCDIENRRKVLKELLEEGEE